MAEAEEAPCWAEPAPWAISIPGRPGLAVEVMPHQAVLLGRWTQVGDPDLRPLTDHWPRLFFWLFECAEDNDTVLTWLSRHRTGRHLVVAIMDISIFGRVTLRRHVLHTAVSGSTFRFHVEGNRQLFDGRCWHRMPHGDAWSPLWPAFHPAPPVAVAASVTPSTAEATEEEESESLASPSHNKRPRLSATAGSS
jgi:hypothetical protein